MTTRVRAWAAWVVIGAAIPIAAGWLLALARMPVIEAAPLLFGAGLVFAWSTPTLIRGLRRGLR